MGSACARERQRDRETKTNAQFLNFRCAAEQKKVLLYAIPKNFAARVNKISAFGRNSKFFICATEQNTILIRHSKKM
jgi:hypothetical protein